METTKSVLCILAIAMLGDAANLINWISALVSMQ